MFQIEDIINCKAIVEYYANEKRSKIFQLLIKKWKVLKEIFIVLRIPYRATISLQKQSLCLSDVFGIWLKMQLHLNACLKQKKLPDESCRIFVVYT